MRPAGVLDLARRGRLYPSVILHGGDDERRRDLARELARTLLCGAPPEERPCGRCRHCRRIGDTGEGTFHPDYRVLERDLKTATSAEATREFLRGAQLAPFEARGQVFVIAGAESLGGEGANALLKILEEPPAGAPRHFLLLAPSQLSLLPTLRSRSLALYLGGGAPAKAGEDVAARAAAFDRALAGLAGASRELSLLGAAAALAEGESFEDPRAAAPWSRAAAAVLRSARHEGTPTALRSRLLALAEALLDAPGWRRRGIPAPRILEGLVSRHLGSWAPGREVESDPGSG